MIRAGDVDVVVTGGMESMSNAPYLLKKARFGYRLGQRRADRLDGLRRAHVDVRRAAHGRCRTRRSRASSGSRASSRTRGPRARTQRAAAAQDARPLRRRDRRRSATSRPTRRSGRDTTVEKLAALKPVFDPEGTTTAGNAPGVNDGASCVIVCSEEWAAKRGLEPLATILSQGYVADDFAYLARTPANAGAMALERAGKTIDDVEARRDQRGVRVGRVELDEAARRRRGAGERERRRGRARPSDRRVGRPHRRRRWCTSCAATAAGSASPRSAPAAARATRSARSKCDPRRAEASSCATAACCSCTGRATTTGRSRKGSSRPGETWEEAALREVREETGLRCALGDVPRLDALRPSAGRRRRCAGGR